MEKSTQETTLAVNTAPEQEPEINETDGAPIFHDPGEEGDGDE